MLTLEEIGSAYSLTRERIRQREKQIVSYISDLLAGKPVSVPVTMDQARFFEVTGSVWRAFVSHWDVVREDYFVEEMKRQAISCPKSVTPASVTLILEQLGMRHKAFKSLANPGIVHSDIKPIWIFSTRYDASTFDVVVKIHNVLTKTLIHPTSLVELTAEMNRKVTNSKNRYTMDFIQRCLEICSSVESLHEGLYQAQLAYLSRAHQAERLIQQENAPMLISDLVREINKAAANSKDRTVNAQNLANQMIASKKFKPIGRSGYWALKAMEVVTDSVLNMMQQAFAYYNQPLSADDVYAYVASHRPVSMASIQSYLSFETTLFIKLPNRLWVLRSWNLADVIDLESEVPKFIKRYLYKYVNKTAVFNDLRDALATQFGISKISASGRLNTQNSVEVFQIDGQKMVRYVPEGRGKRRTGDPSKTLEAQIQTYIRKLLESQPGHSMLLRELTEKAQQQFGCPRHTVYSYISRAEFIEKHKLSSRETMCSLKNKRLYNFEAISRIDDTQLENDIKRAVAQLKVEYVDSAFMLLGKIFEAEISALTKRALAKGYTSHQNILKKSGTNPKLVDMIDFIVITGLTNNGSTLTVIRNSRNYIVHNQLNDNERHKLMENALPMAQLYINAIVDIAGILKE